jgi:hypothetical protein
LFEKEGDREKGERMKEREGERDKQIGEVHNE